MSGLQRQARLGDNDKRGFDVWDVADKKKILENVSGPEAANFLDLGSKQAWTYATRKTKRTLNGKKYAIRFASTK